VPNFVSVALSIAELALGEKSDTQSLSHSPSLFDETGTETFASEKLFMSQNIHYRLHRTRISPKLTLLMLSIIQLLALCLQKDESSMKADTNQVRMMERSWSRTCPAVSRTLGSRVRRLRINETVADDTRLSLDNRHQTQSLSTIN